MLISNFNYHKPKTLGEAYSLLSSLDNTALIAGGTDLLVEMKQGIRNHEDLISLNSIEELQQIRDEEDCIIIGTAVTFREILDSALVRNFLPELQNAVSKIGSHQVRNTATIGGNICTCASCADSVPILIVYDADVEVGSLSDTKRMKITDFQIHHHQTNISKGEILTSVIVQKPQSNFYTSFQKFGLRESASISVASIAVGFFIDENLIKKPRIVSGACSPTPLICNTANQKLAGIEIDKLNSISLLEEIAEATANDISPIDDLRASAEYRKEIIKTLTKRAILEAFSNYKK